MIARRLAWPARRAEGFSGRLARTPRLCGTLPSGRYQLPISTFANPLALDPRTGNVYAQTDKSGAFNLRAAGSGGAGKIAGSALENANVDLADEFTKMIVTQRAYSANARVITTTDEMLDELIRLNG